MENQSLSIVLLSSSEDSNTVTSPLDPKIKLFDEILRGGVGKPDLADRWTGPPTTTAMTARGFVARYTTLTKNCSS
jgi:hypothetical protein